MMYPFACEIRCEDNENRFERRFQMEAVMAFSKAV
jgi:hypothetical protein